MSRNVMIILFGFLIVQQIFDADMQSLMSDFWLFH
jgi:hypothetical protein